MLFLSFCLWSDLFHSFNLFKAKYVGDNKGGLSKNLFLKVWISNNLECCYVYFLTWVPHLCKAAKVAVSSSYEL